MKDAKGNEKRREGNKSGNGSPPELTADIWLNLRIQGCEGLRIPFRGEKRERMSNGGENRSSS